MPIDPMLEKSDLYERPETGKNQHAYCIDIDRDKRDIRVLCNVKPNTSWMETMLHEFGHALYSYHFRSSLPWVLKEQAHIFTTEAVAMFFGRLATNPEWMQAMLGISDADKEAIRETCRKQELHRQLVFSRWVQVMYRFEKSMYADPDQDLNKLWWDLVEKYQMIKKPVDRDMPDWATKIHVATAPCYYHNYLLGELLASQFHYTLCKKLKSADPTKESFANKTDISRFFIKEVFEPGAFYEWNDMIQKATGEKLTPRYYAKQYVK
jgi:peptidyl-dipeptidase A